MSSNKFILSKEAKNQISQFIDNEFIKEAEKEIVLYIKKVNKVTIDYSLYDENKSDSEVKIIEEGPFNLNDYIYTDEFLDELSPVGTYEKTKKEGEREEEYKTVYMYKPKYISNVIYEAVKKNLHKRKNTIYKQFKNEYFNESFIFTSAKWYKRTRDGKDYYDIDLAEISPDKKRSLEERIKTELGNIFKMKFGAITERKMILLKNSCLFEVYNNGCSYLNIENDNHVEIVKECNSHNEKKVIEIFEENFRKSEMLYERNGSLRMKIISSIDARINAFLTVKIYKTENNMKQYLEDGRRFVFGYYNSINGRSGRKSLKSKECTVIQIIRRMAVVENILYEEYLKENENGPSIDDLAEFAECIPWMCYKGLIYSAENIYIKNKAKDKIKEIIMDNPIDEFKETRELKRHFYLHVGETNTGKTYEAISRLMEAKTGVYLAPLRLLALEIQDKLNQEGIPCSLLTGEEEDVIEYAGHVSSTVEKLQTGNYYDVCVIVMVILEVYSFINNIYKYIRRNKRSI